jgi:hypothetical protein
MENDIKKFFDNGSARTAALDKVDELIGELDEIRERDDGYIEHMIGQILKLANHTGDSKAMDSVGSDPDVVLSAEDKEARKLHRGRLSFTLARYAGQEFSFTFEFLVATLLSTTAEEDISRLNPFLTEEEIKRLIDLTVLCLLHSNRLGQVLKCMTAARTLRTVIDRCVCVCVCVCVQI